jgi:hypothetical protein
MEDKNAGHVWDVSACRFRGFTEMALILAGPIGGVKQTP